jgi:hypothetical protein
VEIGEKLGQLAVPPVHQHSDIQSLAVIYAKSVEKTSYGLCESGRE